MKQKLSHILIGLCLIGCLATALPGSMNAETGEYQVQLSWFIDMEGYAGSAHAELFCIQCHQSVKEQALHPDPANVTKAAAAFFTKDGCLNSDCHAVTLKDYEKGVHGRIRFENREKYGNCIDCHDPHLARSTKVKAPTADKKGRSLCLSENTDLINKPAECKTDADCLECHSQAMNEKSGSAEKGAPLCLHCHDQTSKFAKMASFSHMSTIDVTAYRTSEHADNRCTDCHTKSATYGHAKITGDCRQCHLPHDEAEINDAHANVDCEACHLQGSIKVDRKEGRISWQPELPRRQSVSIHHLIDTEQEVNCIRCHTEDNHVGAATMVLPAKSIVCISCHTATFSASDPVTLITLIGVMLIAMVLLSVWLSTEPGPHLLSTILAVVFSRRIVLVLKAVLLDAIIQRRLFAQSKWRWFSHGLIFYPFLLRFGWGFVTLIISLLFPQWTITGALLDKNQPLVAFLFDFTGVLIIAGIGLTVSRKVFTNRTRWPGLPRQEWLSFALMGGIISVGFILEGLRIAMTIDISGKQFAFLGYMISLLFKNMSGLIEVYGYVWYLHAIITGAFIIWLPFSRMFHIVMGPVTVVVNAALDHNKH
jgi:nitrate reductase gamma subunit